jgi:hypothetical protein
MVFEDEVERKISEFGMKIMPKESTYHATVEDIGVRMLKSL